MTTFDPWAPSHVLAGQLRDGVVTSRQATDCYLERIRSSGELNAVVTVDVDRGRSQADEADRAVRERRPLYPVAPVPALPLDQRPVHRRSLTIDGHRQRGVEGYLKLTAWNSLASAAYLPAAVAPVGITQSGLPVGIQIISDYLEDMTAIDVAARLEEAGLAKFIRPGQREPSS